MRGIGAKVDALHVLRSERIEVEKRAEELRRREAAARLALYDAIEASGAQGFSGKRATAKLATRYAFNVADAAKLRRWVRRTGEFDLLYAGVKSAEVLKLEAREVRVPGLERVLVKDVSLSKRR